MGNQLHILNGDATVPEFQKSGIEGKIVVWREALSEGPVGDPIQSDAFWAKRARFIEDALGGEGYVEKMIAELDKIRDLTEFNEVTLWFEYDLFCQVNLLACLNFIHHKKISLVCLGDELDGHLRGLGQIGAKDFITLYDQRTVLTQEDLVFAEIAWEAYSHSSPEKLNRLSPSATFNHLIPAIAAHLTRLPGENGLNQIEEKMLKLIRSGLKDERKLIGNMLREQGYFGLGDLQYFHYLDQIRPLLQEQDLEVSEQGIKILEGKEVFPQPKQYIGGVFRPDYYQSKWGHPSNR